ncbi:MAG: hypothetical protein WD046_02145 [Paracoccaceae bacterium]
MNKLAILLSLVATSAAAHSGHGSLLGHDTEHALSIGLVAVVIVAAVIIIRRYGRR